MAGTPLDADGAARRSPRGLGSDVPSQIEPASAVVHGTGERIEPVTLAPMGLVLVPDPDGLSTGAVYAELDRLRAEGEAPTPAGLDPGPLRRLAGAAPARWPRGWRTTSKLAALWLRPELGARMDAAARGRRARRAGQRLGAHGVRRVR